MSTGHRDAASAFPSSRRGLDGLAAFFTVCDRAAYAARKRIDVVFHNYYNEIAGLRVRPAVATYATVCAQSKGLRAGRSYLRMVLILTLI